MINTNTIGISTITPMILWCHTLMETVPQQAPQHSTNMCIIKNQAATIHINLPTMTRATITVLIITLIQDHGQVLITGQATLIHGQALTIMDIQATIIVHRVSITQDGLANPIAGRVPITQDGQANHTAGRAPIIQDGQANLIAGRVLITQVIGVVHNTITKVHTILHGQVSLITGKVHIIQDGGAAHSTTSKVHITLDGPANLIIGQAHITLDGPANLIIGQAHITHQIGQAPTTTTHHHGKIVLIIIIRAHIGLEALTTTAQAHIGIVPIITILQAHIGQEALTIMELAHIGIVPIIIPRAITAEAMVKAFTITTTTITPQRTTPHMLFTITITVASRNTKRAPRMGTLKPTRVHPTRLSVREETRLSSLLTIGSLSHNRRTPRLRPVCCNPPTTQQTTQ